MNYKDIIKRLSIQEKQNLILEIEAMIDNDREFNRRTKQMDEIQKIVCDEMGMGYDASCREHKYIILRVILATLLLDKGYSVRKTAAFMQKSRLMITRYSQMLKEWMEYPRYYENELSYWYKISVKV